MRKIIITENQKGFLCGNGKYIKTLDAGKYFLAFGKYVIISPIDQALGCPNCPLETLLADENVSKQTSVIEVGDEQLALHYVNGKFKELLTAGKYAFWNTTARHEFRLADISTPYVDEGIPEYVFSKMPDTYYTRVDVMDYHKALLYFDNRFEKLLDKGTYYFWKTNVRVSVRYVDVRLTQMNITGQEILTQDKVSLRINFVCTYRITDYVKILTEIDNYAEQLHVAAQLALREYVGKYKFDEILENKEQISKSVFEKLKAKENALFLEITDAGVKDMILPGEIREIMHTVLVAEKRAQANVISRREEVASTRSLLNTAKLMDENQTLYKLKELEYMERICEKVGNITLSGSGNLLSQLGDMFRAGEAERRG